MNTQNNEFEGNPNWMFLDYSNTWCHVDNAAICHLSGTLYDSEREETELYIDRYGDVGQALTAELSGNWRCSALDAPHRVYFNGRYTDVWYAHETSARCCADTDNVLHENDCFYSDISGEYYEHSENLPNENTSAEYIVDYGDGVEPEFILGAFSNPARIGFEIEKTDFMGCCEEGDEVGIRDLIAAYELDGSCGVEAVTHILPLSMDRVVQSDIFKLMDESRDIIDSDFDDSCGGHMTISIEGYNATELQYLIRPYFGIFYALYYRRLHRGYCNKNVMLDCEGCSDKYSVVNLKRRLLEIRLPSAVTNVSTLKNRYKLMAVLIDHATRQDSFYNFLMGAKPVLLEMYSGRESLVETRMQQAYEFQLMLDQRKYTAFTLDALRSADIWCGDSPAMITPNNYRSLNAQLTLDFNCRRDIPAWLRVAAYA